MTSIQELTPKILRTNAILDGWCVNEKAVRLAAAVLETEAQISVELGVYGGRGVIAMAMAHQFGQHGVAWGFDPWKKGPCLEGENDRENDEWWSKVNLEHIYVRFVERVHEFGLFSWCYFARLRSDQAVSLFEDESVAVIHSDSNHSEQISCDEVDRWTPKLKVGGYWFADDADWPTIQKAKKLLLTKGMKLIEDHGQWAVYQKISHSKG